MQGVLEGHLIGNEGGGERKIISEQPEVGEELVVLLGLFPFYSNCIQNVALTRKHWSCHIEVSHVLPLS